MHRASVRVYTGNGKGKTTAALGLAMRAAGAGLKVFISQFVKAQKCSEHRGLDRFADVIEYRQYGRGLIKRAPSKADIAAAREGMRESAEKVRSGAYDLVILDEVNVAVHLGLISVEEVLDLVKGKPASVELVLTGRNAHEALIDAADLAVEMREVKHYREKGVHARKGIEM